MGKAIKWLKGLFGIKKENVNKCKIGITCFGNFTRDTVISVAVDGGSDGLCHNPATIPPNITTAEAAWLSLFDKEQSKHAIVVAAATAAAADAAVAAAHAADAVVRLANQNRGNGAAMKIQTVFRGFLVNSHYHNNNSSNNCLIIYFHTFKSNFLFNAINKSTTLCILKF